MSVPTGALRVAVIDRDSAFLQVLGKRLDAAGWQHRVLSGAVPAEELVSMKINALLVDLTVLPPDDSWSFLERVAGLMPGLGVIVCTTTDSTVAQRVRGLRLGADDWIAKPCHPEEVMARIEAVVRRRRRASGEADRGPLVVGELEIRADQFQAYIGGRSLDLTRREFELLQILSESAGPGDRARGDLPPRLGLRDGPRRPLRRRLRPQAPLRRSRSAPRAGATSTRTSGSATASRRSASAASAEPPEPAEAADEESSVGLRRPPSAERRTRSPPKRYPIRGWVWM